MVGLGNVSRYLNFSGNKCELAAISGNVLAFSAPFYGHIAEAYASVAALGTPCSKLDFRSTQAIGAETKILLRGGGVTLLPQLRRGCSRPSR
jgi:hypothetical protein